MSFLVKVGGKIFFFLFNGVEMKEVQTYGCTTIRRKSFRPYDNWSHMTFGRCDISPSTTFGRKK